MGHFRHGEQEIQKMVFWHGEQEKQEEDWGCRTLH